MERQEVIARLASHHAELDRLGIVSLALFGSVGRDEADASSDIDLLFTHRRPFGLLSLARATQRISELLDGADIDLVPRDSVLPEFSERIGRAAVRVF